jgi:hypothetical protein
MVMATIPITKMPDEFSVSERPALYIASAQAMCPSKPSDSAIAR